MLRRTHQRFDGALAIQYVDATEERWFTEFAESDPHIDALTSAYFSLSARLRNARSEQVQADRQFNNISDCQTEADVLSLMRRVCERAGGTSCLYHWVRPGDDARGGSPIYDTHVVLAGCQTAWVQMYERRMATDPVMEYARTSTAPVRGLRHFRGGQWFAQEAGMYGLRSNVFFPASRRDAAVFGLLHVSSHIAEPAIEERIWQNQRELRGLAEELLDWPAIQYRRAVTQRYMLTQRERAVLRWVFRGGDASHVASEFDLSVKQVYRIYRDIKTKMDRDDIRACARIAADGGLFDALD
ncbi:hypothetical protein WS97_00585 [Burkholderia territorii]|nr:hypothetical protein WS97_00585 [Burkholderia territorii]